MYLILWVGGFMQVLARIEDHKVKLESHQLIQWMKESQNPLAFSPAMTFFVLGFKDILSYLKRAEPKTQLDLMINVHCEEDSHHWLWFISDLENLGLLETDWGKNFSHLLRTVWSNQGWASRDMVYHTVHLAKQNPDALAHLTLIECLEAAFAVFINNLSPHFSRADWNKNLRYFGDRHHEDESNHAMGSWTEEGADFSSDMANPLAQADDARLVQLVDEVFAGFDRMFVAWFQQRELYLPVVNQPATVGQKELPNLHS